MMIVDFRQRFPAVNTATPAVDAAEFVDQPDQKVALDPDLIIGIPVEKLFDQLFGIF